MKSIPTAGLMITFTFAAAAQTTPTGPKLTTKNSRQLWLFGGYGSSAELRLTINGVRSARGEILIALYDDPAGFQSHRQCGTTWAHAG